MNDSDRKELDELRKKYGEGVPVGLLVGYKKANQLYNKLRLDIVLGKATDEQKLEYLNYLAARISSRLDAEIEEDR